MYMKHTGFEYIHTMMKQDDLESGGREPIVEAPDILFRSVDPISGKGMNLNCSMRIIPW